MQVSGRHEQNVVQLGRTLQGHSYPETRSGIPGGRERQAGGQRLEHRESLQVLPLITNMNRPTSNPLEHALRASVLK